MPRWKSVKLHNRDFNSPSQSIWHLKFQRKAHTELQLEKSRPFKNSCSAQYRPFKNPGTDFFTKPKNSEITKWNSDSDAQTAASISVEF